MKGKEVVYRGKPHANPKRSVTVDGRTLPMRPKEVNHSPTGYAWGYEGSGPAQLAYAILRDFLGHEPSAKRFYQQFKTEVVARFPMDSPWELSGEKIMDTDTYRAFLAHDVMES